MWDDKIDLANVKDNEENSKSYLGEIKKEIKNVDQKNKKIVSTILKCSTKLETKLLTFMMIILQWSRRHKYRATKGKGRENINT